MSSSRRRRIEAPNNYRSLASFYRADPRRLGSREADVGLWWRERGDGPLHRAAWIEDTGELYLTRLGIPEGHGGEVEVLARAADRRSLNEALEGWRERCGEADSLAWLRERAATLSEGPRLTEARLAALAQQPDGEALRRVPLRTAARRGQGAQRRRLLTLR